MPIYKKFSPEQIKNLREILDSSNFYPSKKKIKEIAEERLQKHRFAMKQTYDLLQIKLGSYGNLKDKERLMSFQPPEDDEGSVYAQIGEKMAGVEAEVGDLVKMLSGLKGTFRALVREIGEKGKRCAHRRVTIL